MKLYEELREALKEIIGEYDLDLEEVSIRTSALTEEEAIGITERKDFPILSGREKLVEARFRGSIGQAYTDLPTAYRGSLGDILALDLEDDRNKVLFIASLNAILRDLGQIDRTIHCKNEEPELCAKKLVNYLGEEYGSPKIGLVGFQPAMLDRLSDDFDLRVLDLNPANIGQEKYGILVEDGYRDREDFVAWADLILVTGSTLSNGSIEYYMGLDKEVLYYGTTIAGAAYLKNLKRICFCAD